MVIYHGGKRQYGHKIADAIVVCLPENRQFSTYCEPFCGMLGIFRHVLTQSIGTDLFGSYLASDLHASVVAMWQAVQRGWVPEEDADKLLTPETAQKLMCQSSPSPLKGYFGFAFSMVASSSKVNSFLQPHVIESMWKNSNRSVRLSNRHR